MFHVSSVLKQEPLPLYYTRAIIISPPQLFLSLGRRGWRSSRERAPFCLYWAVLEWTGQTARLRYIRWQASPSSGVQFQSVAAFQCTLKDGEEEAVMTDYQWAVFCLLTPKTPHHHPPPLSLPPSSGLSHTISPSIKGFSPQTLECDFF